MNVEEVDINSIQPDPANCRTHSPRNLDIIKASLARFGLQKPLVVDAAGVLIAGSGTLAAARALGWATIKVVRSSLTGTDRAAYGIADNRSGETSEWDDDALARTLAAMADDADALSATGFDPGEIQKLIGGGDALPADAAGTEYTEAVADEVELCTCPNCGHKFPA